MSGPWDSLILSLSKKFLFEPELIGAIIEVESASMNYKCRYERNWSNFVDVPGFAKKLSITEETETMLQKTSIGVMQVMGAVARQHKYKGDLLRLTDPFFGIYYGCTHLSWFRANFGYQDDSLISAYNAGKPRKDPQSNKYSNQTYIDKVNYWLNFYKANGVFTKKG